MASNPHFAAYKRFVRSSQIPQTDAPEVEDPSPESKNVGNILELKHVVEVPLPGMPGRTHLRSRKKYDEESGLAGNDGFKKYAILLKFLYNEDWELTSTKLEIQCEPLKTYLRSIGRPHRSINFDAKAMVIADPFFPLFFLRHQLSDKEADKETDPELRDEIRLLLDFINSKDGLQDTIDKYDSLVGKNKISFDMLWTLFPPNTLVYHHDEFVEQCFIVESAELLLDFTTGEYTARFTLIGGGHDGKKFGLYRHRMSVPMFSGIVDIAAQNLPIIPLQLLTDHEEKEIMDRLIDRGRKYVGLQKKRFSYRYYDDAFQRAVTTGHETMIRVEQMRLKTNRRIIIDAGAAAAMVPRSLSYRWQTDGIIFPSYEEYMESFKVERKLTRNEKRLALSNEEMMRFLMRRGGRRARRGSSSSDSADPGVEQVNLPKQMRDKTKRKKLSKMDLLLCPHRIDVFLLDRKIWVWALVSGIKHIQWHANPFAELQLEANKKDMIRNLVRSFNTTDDPFEGFYDVVEGKGKGLVFSLHGPPGLGKTMTAELVAEQTHRPLYHVTTGGLGTDVEKVEKRLVDVFKLGWRWGAVVLIDEADVLLAKRSVDNLERSGIVAVFLRLIEYYQGLLFLTTNRENEIDDAFKNRIHVSIEYKSPSASARTAIWKNLLSKERDKKNLDNSWTEAEFETLGELDVNGRDIRNLIRTAYGIAKSKNTRLGVRHVRDVIVENSRAKNVDEIVGRLRIPAERTATIPSSTPTVENDYVASSATASSGSDDEAETDSVGNEGIRDAEPEGKGKEVQEPESAGEGTSTRPTASVHFVSHK